MTPLARLTLRRLRLDFGDGLKQYNDNQVIGGTATVSDDYYDGTLTTAPWITPTRPIWGDSAVSASSGYYLRLVSDAAWKPYTSNGMWRSWTAGTSWAFTSLTPPASTTFNEHMRLGVYPVSGTDNFYVWYVDNYHDLYRITLNTSTWTWSDKTSSGYSLSDDLDGVAIHPISADRAIVVGFSETPPSIWLQLRYWTGSGWSGGSLIVARISDELVWSDAHWSDAEYVPGSSTEVAIALNLSCWGSAQVALLNRPTNILAQPRELLPSAEQWGNMRCRVSALTNINSRLWAVTTREPVASGDVPMAHHVALASSADGLNWTDSYFVSTTPVRGKLLYSPDTAKCYVAGNATVAEAVATNTLGYDASSQKYQVDEVYGLTLGHAGTGAAPECEAVAQNEDGGVSGSGLLEVGNELTVELGADGESYGQYGKYLLARPTRTRAFAQDEIEISAIGYSGRVLGDAAYRPAAAKVYDGPYSLYSIFESGDGQAQMTVRQVTGTWIVEEPFSSIGHHVLYCQVSDAIALVPHSLTAPGFVMRTCLHARTSIEGIYFVFWYEDEENYWQAGLYNDSGTHKLVIDRFVDGTKTNKASDTTGSISQGNWYTMYLEVRPGRVRAYFKNAKSFNYSSPTADTSYDTMNEDDAPPVEYHAGLRVEGYTGWEGTSADGTIESSGEDWIEDQQATFDYSVVGQWVKCAGQTRKIVNFTTTKLYVDTPWGSEPGAGEEYGVYITENLGGPRCWFSELLVHENIVPCTVDDVVDNILALAGVARSDVFTSSVPAIGSNPPVLRDIDIKMDCDTATSSFILWASTTETTGASAYSGLRVKVYDASATYPNTVELEAVTSDGSSGQTVATLAWHPAARNIQSATTRRLRVLANEHFIIVTADGQFLTAFPGCGHTRRGYCARGTTGTAWATEFPTVLDSFIWDTNQPAGTALGRLLQGRRAKLVERNDGSLAVSRFDTVLGDAGTYSTPVTELALGEGQANIVSLVEMVGAEERAFYIDEVMARRGLCYIQADNPTVWSQEEAIEEARRLVRTEEQYLQAGRVVLYAPDPAVELEDEFTADGNDYIVTQLTASIELDENGVPGLAVRIAGRGTYPGITTGVWGSYTGDFNYDEGTEYG